MSPIKNEHIVWAYAERNDGAGQVLIVGLTPTGIEYMQKEYGQSLVIDPPGRGFANVTQVLVFMEKDKASLKATLAQAGILISEAH